MYSGSPSFGIFYVILFTGNVFGVQSSIIPEIFQTKINEPQERTISLKLPLTEPYLNWTFMSKEDLLISSMHNPRVKQVVKLRKQSERKRSGVTIIEGYREILRALENEWPVQTLFYCRTIFLGENEDQLIQDCRARGAKVFECSENVFRKMSYRDRPDGLIALAPIVEKRLEDLKLTDNPLILVAEHLEKPGNLGTLLRSADAAGVDAVIVCNKCTDINNPNVVRASIESEAMSSIRSVAGSPATLTLPLFTSADSVSTSISWLAILSSSSPCSSRPPLAVV